MNKVITINLNGRAYQLEEEGYKALIHYLDKASSNLGNNPDKEEIMADFEQAVADKCDNFLNSHKTVVTIVEIQQIIQEMGPVDGANADEEPGQKGSEKNSEQPAPKRLYQIREGAMISGVCNGLGAYFNIDVTLVRLIFVALTVLTHGAWILVYMIMSVLIPYANTSEEKAAARGELFNAHELLQRAREKYSEFDKQYWKSQTKRWKHEMKNHWKKNIQKNSEYWKAEWEKNQTGLVSVGMGIGAAMLGIAMVFITLLWIAAIISLLSTGSLFGMTLPDAPLWLVIVLLTCAYNILLLPIRIIKSPSMYQHGARGGHGPYGPYDSNGWFGILDAVMWFTIIGFFGWAVWTYVPQSHVVWDKAAEMWQRTTPSQTQETEESEQTQITQSM